MSLSLVSSFASFGSATDENTVWDTKLHEVQAILRQVAIILSFVPHDDALRPIVFTYVF